MNSLWLESANLHLHSLLVLISLVMIFSMMRIKRRSPQITVAVKTWSNMEHLMTWICPLHPPPTPTRHHSALCFLSVTHNTVPLPCALTLHIGIHVVQLLNRSTLYQKNMLPYSWQANRPPIKAPLFIQMWAFRFVARITLWSHFIHLVCASFLGADEHWI